MDSCLSAPTPLTSLTIQIHSLLYGYSLSPASDLPAVAPDSLPLSDSQGIFTMSSFTLRWSYSLASPDLTSHSILINGPLPWLRCTSRYLLAPTARLRQPRALSKATQTSSRECPRIYSLLSLAPTYSAVLTPPYSESDFAGWKACGCRLPWSFGTAAVCPRAVASYPLSIAPVALFSPPLFDWPLKRPHTNWYSWQIHFLPWRANPLQPETTLSDSADSWTNRSIWVRIPWINKYSNPYKDWSTRSRNLAKRGYPPSAIPRQSTAPSSATVRSESSWSRCLLNPAIRIV